MFLSPDRVGLSHMKQRSLATLGMTPLLSSRTCANSNNSVIAGGVTPALERSEGPFAFL